MTTTDIRRIKRGQSVTKKMPNRLACVSLRNLVSYVNLCYPVEGYRYRTHITRDNTITITLEEKNQ